MLLWPEKKELFYTKLHHDNFLGIILHRYTVNIIILEYRISIHSPTGCQRTAEEGGEEWFNITNPLQSPQKNRLFCVKTGFNKLYFRNNKINLVENHKIITKSIYKTHALVLARELDK